MAEITINDLNRTIEQLAAAPLGLGKMALGHQALTQAAALFKAYDAELQAQRIETDNMRDTMGRQARRIAELEARLSTPPPTNSLAASVRR